RARGSHRLTRIDPRDRPRGRVLRSGAFHTRLSPHDRSAPRGLPQASRPRPVAGVRASRERFGQTGVLRCRYLSSRRTLARWRFVFMGSLRLALGRCLLLLALALLVSAATAPSEPHRLGGAIDAYAKPLVARGDLSGQLLVARRGVILVER